jgi:uncharacterized protein involved in copper resistance
MKLSYALLLAAAGAPLAASAQADQAAPPPYRSVFTGYVSTPATTLAPDQSWRQSNRDVGAPAAGHAGHMHHAAGGATGQDAAGHAAMDHGKMDHSKMDHSKMDHGKMHGHAGHGKPPSTPPANPPASPAPAQHQHKDH